MKTIQILIAALPMAVMPLAGCAAYPDQGGSQGPAGEDTMEREEPSAGGEREYTEEERAFLDGIGACREDGLAAYVGQSASPETLAAMMKESGAKVQRVVGPGEAMTMDYRTDRLTVLTDEEGRVAQARCG
ncbi:I78 family peptidase inhibitor [Erythrobacteraceae bacterium WH01K]|nr:I78 family peptidase inhibitor [Erythrobacteraceae bacterium WH01K]